MITVEAHALYPGYQPGLPEIVLILRPAALRSRGLLLGRYAVQVCETPAELSAVQRWITTPAQIVTLPDDRQTLDMRGPLSPSRSRATWIAGWIPPREGWPWLAVISLPGGGGGYARGVYAIKAFETESPWLDHLAGIRAKLPAVEVRVQARGEMH